MSLRWSEYEWMRMYQIQHRQASSSRTLICIRLNQQHVPLQKLVFYINYTAKWQISPEEKLGKPIMGASPDKKHVES